MPMPETIYAHVAIPKTASTTVLHVLRREFFMRCLEVRPFSPSSDGVFSARDLRLSFCLNPAIECISGHAVHAYSNLETFVNDIKYFTTLRDPIQRCISAYFLGLETLKQNFTFEQHLRTENKNDIQTRWIAGRPDLEAAKQILDERFWLVGRAERLAEFMLLLGRALTHRGFKPTFQSKNMRATRGAKRDETPESILEMYGDEIVARNYRDIQLLEFVDAVILPRQRVVYGPTFADDLKALETSANHQPLSNLCPYIDYVVRKGYYDPLIGLLRIWNGLSYGGRIQ